MKDITDELNEWRDISYSWIRLFVLLSLIFRFNSIPIKIPANYFVDFHKLSLKFKLSGKISIIANSVLKEKNKIGGLTPPDFQDFL